MVNDVCEMVVFVDFGVDGFVMDEFVLVWVVVEMCCLFVV